MAGLVKLHCGDRQGIGRPLRAERSDLVPSSAEVPSWFRLTGRFEPHGMSIIRLPTALGLFTGCIFVAPFFPIGIKYFRDDQVNGTKNPEEEHKPGYGLP